MKKLIALLGIGAIIAAAAKRLRGSSPKA